MTEAQRSTRPALLSAAVLAAGVLLLLVGIFLISASWTGSFTASPSFHGTAYEPPEAAPEFALLDHTGRTVRLADYRGKSVLLFFGFVNCPDVCPFTLSRLSRAIESLGRRSSEVQVLLVTVDPERDSPQALAAYVQRFGAQVAGLTGDAEALEKLRAAYGAYAVHQHDAGEPHPQVIHSSHVFGIDHTGQLRALLRADGTEEQLHADLRTLVALR